MISKKMRNISMVCLSLVLALSLAFGLSSFSSIKKADAASVTIDATNWTVGGKGSISNGQFTTTATSSGSSNNATLESVDSYSNITQISITINVPNTYLAGKISINGTSVKTIKKNDYTKGDHVIVISNPSTSTGKVKLDFYGDGGGCKFVVKSIDITTAVAAETYDVTFNKNTEDTVANMPNGTDITKIPNTTPLRAGYTFVKWNTNADGSGTDYSLGATVSDNLTLYAIWQQSESESTFITKALPEGNILSQITSEVKADRNANETLLDGAMKLFGGDGGNNTKCTSTEIAIGGKNGCIAFYLDKPAIVTLKFGNENLDLIEDDQSGANFDKDTAAVNKSVIFSTTTETEIYLNSGYYRIVNSYTGGSTAYKITTFNVKYAPDGYTYIGKVGSVNAFAKAEFLGLGFKKSAESGGVRFGFGLKVVNVNEEDITTLTANEISAKFNRDVDGVEKTFDYTQDVEYKTGVGTSSGEFNGYVFNLVITGLTADNAINYNEIAFIVNLNATINNVTINSNETSAVTIKSIATEAYENSKFGAVGSVEAIAQAKMYLGASFEG